MSCNLIKEENVLQALKTRLTNKQLYFFQTCMEYLTYSSDSMKGNTHLQLFNGMGGKQDLFWVHIEYL